MSIVNSPGPVENVRPTVQTTASPTQNLNEFVSDRADKTLGSQQSGAVVLVDNKAKAPASNPDKAKPQYMEERNVDGDGKMDDHLSKKPLRQPGEKWDGGKILNSQYQLSTEEGDDKKDQFSRCGPSSVLAGSVMAGPEATNRMVDKLAAKSTDPATKADLQQIHERIGNGTATHEDLNHVQQAMFKQYAKQENGVKGMTPTETAQMQKDLCDHVAPEETAPIKDIQNDRMRVNTNHQTAETAKVTAERNQQLKPGESYTMALDANASGGDANHAVQVGKDAQGRLYVYDPYPKSNGSAVTYQDKNPDAFNYYTSGRMGKSVGQTRVNRIDGGVQSFD